MKMFTFVRHHQHDIDRNSAEVDCEPNPNFLNIASHDPLGLETTPPSIEFFDGSMNVTSVGTMSSVEPKCHLTSLPSEMVLKVLGHLDAQDLVDLSNTCHFLNRFIRNNANSLSRFDMSCMEFRVNKDQKCMNMNLMCPVRKTNRLWKTIRFDSQTFNNIDLFPFTRRLRIYRKGVFRFVDVMFTKNCLSLLADFIEESVKCSYPIYSNQIPFEVQLGNCNYTRTSQKDIHLFINRIIGLGCASLTLNSVSSEDFIKVCKALGQSKIQRLSIFRIHSDDVTSARTEPLRKLMEPFCKNDRKTHRIVIDGIQVPLDMAEWIMVAFCCTPFYPEPPPSLRIVLAIHHSYSRQELYDMLANVRTGVNDARARLKHRLNHVYLELGMYESDVYLTQNQHCVVDVKLMKNKYGTKQDEVTA